MQPYEEMIERFSLNAPHVALLKNRVVTVVGEINTAQAQRTVEELLFVDSEYPSQPVTLQIMSPGGDIAAGLAILDTCKRISGEVSTVGTGTCASMGAVLLAAAASPGKRFMTRHAELMLHQPSGSVQGCAADIEAASAHILRTRKTLEGIIADASGLDADKVRELCRNGDTWLSAQEALELHLIDQIIESR